DDREPEVRARDSNEGIRARIGRRGAETRGPAGGNFERSGLRGVGSGKRSADCGELFGKGFERQAPLQKGFARGLWAAAGAAGADVFLMPSRYEPSGLNQMYSLKYGTVPIVRATGGLDDSIEPFDMEHGTGTGFKFVEYSGEALLYAVRQALHHHMDERIWKRIQLNGMAKDFSWKGPAREYGNLYEAARVARGFAPIAQSAEKVRKAHKTERIEKTEK